LARTWARVAHLWAASIRATENARLACFDARKNEFAREKYQLPEIIIQEDYQK
jgi:hypothetical protein